MIRDMNGIITKRFSPV